jgi:hypothetical protein
MVTDSGKRTTPHAKATFTSRISSATSARRSSQCSPWRE